MITITFDKVQYKTMLSALKSVEKTARRESTQMPLRCATDYQMALIDAVVSQKYTFKKFTPRYESWKSKQPGVTMPGFWKLRGDFIKSLTVFKYDQGGPKGWVGGVAPGALNREGKLIRMYAVPNERIRPIFELTRRDYAASRWPQRGGESLNTIKAAWR